MDARQYHERTKHSPASVQADRHFLDWAIQPLPFKIYRGLEPIPLPHGFAESPAPALPAIACPGTPRVASVPDLRALARLCHFTAGITRRRVYPDGREFAFRAAACTGALYHIDVYLVCGDLPGLGAGVYHFGPHDFALRRLRPGDYRAVVAEAAVGEPAAVDASAFLIFASTFWRNAWKYRARAYRHCFWDTGTMLANLLAVTAADRIPARLILGFVDETINRLLGLDAEREAAVSLVAIGHQPQDRLAPAPPLRALSLETVPLSSREVDYPAIRAAHAASSLATAEEVHRWRQKAWLRELPAPSGPVFPLRPLADPPATTLDRTILGRGSARHFARVALAFEQLSTLLIAATRGVPADFLPGEDQAGGLTHMYLIVNAVDGLPPGAYVYHRSRGALELLRQGAFRREAGFLALWQELGADASVNCYMLAELDPILQRLGDRGYRAAQLEAAIIGGKLYLAAYALGLGATGLTFFDDEVTRFFSPHAAGQSVMFLAAVGPRRARRRRA